MAETKKTSKSRQKPIKTEWNSRCVLFTYFQGDISTVVDEHFSRALSNIKSPQKLSPLRPSQDVAVKNERDMSPNQWRSPPQWTKSQPESSFASSAASHSLNVSGAMAMDRYPLALTGNPSVHPRELWHFSTLPSSSSSEPGYSRAFPGGSMVPEPKPEGKHESLVSLLHQERCLACPPETATREDLKSAQIAGRPGLLVDLPPDSAHYKKIHFAPNHAVASASIASERSQSPEKRQDLYYY